MGKRGEEIAILAALFAMTFASTSQVMIVAPILPRIGEELGVAEALQGTLITSYGLMAGLCALISGPVSDFVGRRRVLLIGTGWMAVALLLHGLANSYVTLLAVRALAGMAGGILGGVAVAYVGDYFPYERRGLANGWVMSGFALGQVLGIPIGAVMAQEFGFRSPFYAFALLMALAFGLTLAMVPQPNVPLASELSLRTAVAKYWSLTTRLATGVAAASYLLMFLGVGLYLAYLPTWLEGRFDVNGRAIAGMFVVGGIGAVIMNPIAGKFSDRTGRKSLILASCVLFAAIAAATPFVIPAFYWWAHGVFFAAMAAASMRIPPIQSLLSALVPADERGSLMSLTSACGQSGFALGGSLAGLLYAQASFVACTSASAAAVLVMAVMVWLWLPEPSEQEVHSLG